MKKTAAFKRKYLAVSFDSGKTLTVAYSGSFPTDDQLAFIGSNLGAGEPTLVREYAKKPDPKSIAFVLDTYKEGYKGKLQTTDSELMKLNGMECTVLQAFTTNDNEIDVNVVGTMYQVQLEGGKKITLFADELTDVVPVQDKSLDR